MADDRDEIRQRIDIVELVGQRVALKRAGKHWKGLCPFHNDRNPSFIVNRELGRYKCWSCGAQGDIFNWTMETQRVDFAEAMRILAQQAGVTLQRKGGEGPSRRENYEAAMKSALEFFRASLEKFGDARAYAESRGLGGEVGDAWEIGYAPDVGDVLATTLKKKGFTLADAKELFLVDSDAGGGFFDRFRGRLIFPIRDERGQLVAFGGRVLGQGMPKYINSGDTPLYSKSKVLYGMHRAKAKIAEERTAVLVEGYLDVIACHRAGVTNAIASLGTALAEDHVRLLKRWCEKVIILYDQDAAGIKATQRASELLMAGGVSVQIAVVPEGGDPDTLLTDQGPGAVQQVVRNTVAPLEFQLAQLRTRLEIDTDEYWREAVAILATAPNAMELERYLQPLAAEYPGMTDKAAARSALLRMVGAARKSKRAGAGRTEEEVLPVVASSPKMPGGEQTVFRALLALDTRQTAWLIVRQPELFTSPAGKKLALAIQAAFPNQAPEGNAASWLHELGNSELEGWLADLGMADGPPVDGKLLGDIQSRMLKKVEKRAVGGLKSEAATDDEALRALSDRLKNLNK